jgi:hypothetical protein
VEPRERIRSLILAGDNRLKRSGDARAAAKARASFEEALALAREHGLEEAVRLVELRLAELDARDR